MKKITISLTALSFLLFSCNNNADEKSKEQTKIETIEDHHRDKESEVIEFNNGEKWVVDTNMITHIRNMENDVITFANVEQKNYKSLAEKLHANIDLLTSNCTMEGKAHDELHKWLLPYIDMVKALSKVTDETEASKQFENIQTSFTTFNKYFQ